jgi:signal transduction histidine kinase
VVSARDVTARVERERQLRRQNDRLDEFASVVSHDLRNPLNVAKGRVDLLAAQYDSEHVPPVQRALGRMERIIEDTLTLAKQGQTVAETEPIRISELVSDCWATVDADAATVEVVDEFTFRGDRGRLRHVFENLFRNALEHGTADSDDDESRADDGDTAPGGSVTITVGLVEPFPTTTRGTGTVSKGIYVEDDGPGIPEEKRDTVFEPGHTSTDDGTGFGLTIVRRIAEAHGWEVDVGRGTRGGARFEFTDVTFADG